MSMMIEASVAGTMAHRFMNDRSWVSRQLNNIINNYTQGGMLTQLLMENDFIAFGEKLKGYIEDVALSEANDLVSEYPEIAKLTVKESLQKATLFRVGYREGEDD